MVDRGRMVGVTSHASIFAFRLGNESGFGRNLTPKRLDQTHYPEFPPYEPVARRQ